MCSFSVSSANVIECRNNTALCFANEAGKPTLSIENKTVQGPVKSDEGVRLCNTTVLGDNSVYAGEKMKLNNVSAGDVTAKGSINIDSSTLGNVSSLSSCNIKNCPQITSVYSRHAIQMINCRVSGNVQATHQADVKDSVISGTLSFSCGKHKTAKLQGVHCPKVVITYREEDSGDNYSKITFFSLGSQRVTKKITLPEQYALRGMLTTACGSYAFTHFGRTVTYSGDTSQILIQGTPLSELIKKYGASDAAKKEDQPSEIILTLDGDCKIDEVVFEEAKGRVVCSDGSDFKGLISFS